ncbi:MAG: aminomethyl-transferring glycine dehydrogenase, partial [Mycobacteriales bacterium]
VVGHGSLEELAKTAVPDAIRATERLQLPPAASEQEAIAELRALAAQNTVQVPMLGLGYSGTFTPPVVLRNVLENPAWYTAYTPYQPEISQGRLEALLNFQTMIGDLTGLPTSNASLLDEGTAAAEAMTLCRRQSKAPADAVFAVDDQCHPQTIAVIRTRALPLGIEVQAVDVSTSLPSNIFGLLVQYPGTTGQVRDLKPLAQHAHDSGALLVVAADLLALTLLESPGDAGADVAVGTSQRFGVPLGYGGPHAGYMAVRAGLERAIPGRLVGVSVDAEGHKAYRLALQTREQHIRREKATSNICTAQVLLAVIAGMYAVWHGPEGLTTIARRTHRYAALLARALGATGAFFDTITVSTPRAAAVVDRARQAGVDMRLVDGHTVGIATDETTTRAHLDLVVEAFELPKQDWDALDSSTPEALPEALRRTSPFLTHEVFRSHHSETALLRYLRRLADKDLALDRSMIPLGSCTMKLNATTEMEPLTWPEFGAIHPFTPTEHARGYRQLITDLERWLCEITGYDAVSLQPNAGSQGELAGLLAIHEFHRAGGHAERDVCLIPASAHGTNAASAVMAGLKVVVVGTTPHGDVDVEDLKAKIAEHKDDLAAIMITYPSTHGVYEHQVTEICGLVHEAGGQVYVDGANLNALVGLAKPGKFGADVSHLNLHKTFCIPHGGGGPGVGPVAVRSHLAPYLPNHPLNDECGPASGPGPISAAPYGSAGILPISWAYVRMMGGDGLTRATQVAVLSANYIAARLQPHYPVLYTGRGGLVAHECIIDLRQITKETGVSVDDVAKRLIDYGFHAPTMSFPVAGTLMIEPTESEDLAEIDRFCDAMIAIKAEIDDVDGEGRAILAGAPHTAASVIGELPYERERAAYPAGVTKATKYWPPVRRIDGAYGDRNLMCSCPPMDELD